MAFGRSFGEFEPRQIFEHWPGRTISEAHPLHTDAQYGAQTQHGCLVVGTLVFSIVVGMSGADISGRAIAHLEYEQVKHVGPVFHGDTIYARTKILAKRESESKKDCAIVYVEREGYNQRGETVLLLQRRMLIPKRPSEQ